MDLIRERFNREEPAKINAPFGWPPLGQNGRMIKGIRRWAAPRVFWPDVSAVARSLLGVLVVVAVALQWGSPGAAVSAAGSAAIAGATALQDSPRGRIHLVVAVSLQMGLAVLVGSLTSAYSGMFVAVVAVWCFAAGMQWALGANAGLVGAASSALLVTPPQLSVSPSAAVTSAALAVVGGLTQAALIAVWPRHRWRVQRDALMNAYRSLGTDARNLATDPHTRLDTAPLIWLREAFTLAERQARRRPPAYRGWYGMPERISVTLSAFRGLVHDAGDRGKGAADVLMVAAEVLDAIADRGRTARPDAERALPRVDAAIARLSGPTPAAAQRLSAQLHEAAALRFTGRPAAPRRGEELRRPDPVSILASGVDVVRSQLTPTSPILRHAVRLACATAVGTAVARFTGVEHGYWIPLTVLMVLRPETAHTYTRCVTRIVGNVVGISVASAVAMIWHPAGLAAAVLAVVFLGIAYAVSGVGYAALSAALAAAIVFLIDISGVADGATIGDRLFATVIGGALAVAAHLLLPDQSLIRLHQRAGELLKTEVDYAAMVVKAFVHELEDPADALQGAWQRAARARAAFEAAAGSTRVESRENRKWLRSYRAALNSVTGACATLESNLPPHPSPTLSREFIVAVDDYVEALRGDPPSPAEPWNIDAANLSAANQQLRQAAAMLNRKDAAARVLVGEVATITSSLFGVTVDERPLAES
jgi:uncharacterized membrane protein YccC